jgi:hypothetical protein
VHFLDDGIRGEVGFCLEAFLLQKPHVCIYIYNKYSNFHFARRKQIKCCKQGLTLADLSEAPLWWLDPSSQRQEMTQT